MSKLCFNLDDVIGEMAKMQCVTLQHAAEISPFVTERTIGADLESWQDGKQQKKPQQKQSTGPTENERNLRKGNRVKSATEEDNQEKRSPLAKNVKEQTALLIVAPLPPLSPPNSNNLDYQAINTSVLLREAEQQRQQAMRKQMLSIQERQFATSRRSLDCERRQLEERSKWLEQKRRNDTQLLRDAEQQATYELKQQAQQLETLRKQTQRQLHLISFQAVSQYQHKFRAKYEIVAKLLMSIDKQALLPCTEYNRRLKELIQMFEQLLTKMKSGDCGPQELKTADSLCRSLDALEESIIVELENIVKREQEKADVLKQQQEREEKEKLEQQKVDVAQTTRATAATITTLGPTLDVAPTQVLEADHSGAFPATQPTTSPESSMQYVSVERFQLYTQINSFYQEKVERVKPLQTDEAMKKYRFACQKAINIPVNAISAVSPQHLQDKFEKLCNFIAGQPVKTAEGQISVNDHPLGRDYCILLMAKKFVSQGDTAISSNPQAAFPVASVIVSLWKLVPDFGHLFLAYTYKESPFLVPYFIPQKRDQPVQEYYKVLGYRVSADGQLEQQDMYLKRQAGIARLYAAVMITTGRQLDASIAHPYPLSHFWRWLTNFVLLEPLPDICATLLLEFLQTVSVDMWSTYGKQFVKLLVYIQQQYFPRLSAVDEGGPKARLELLLGKFLREGQIPKAQGLLPAGFW